MASSRDEESITHKAKRKRKVDQKNPEHGFTLANLKAFLFESAFHIVTWVCIGACFLSASLFFSKDNMRGVYWSGVFLAVFIILMLGLIGDRFFFHSTGKPASESKDFFDSKSVKHTEDRPWLNVELFPAGPIYYLPQQAELCAFFPVKFRITNTGRSPSSGIQLTASVFFGRFQENPRDRQRKIASSKGNPFQIGVVFPAIPEESTMTWVKPISEMKEAGINPGAPTIEQVKHFDAYVGGCITYTWGANPAFTGETGFLYEINVPSPTGGNIVPEIGKEIPLERLAFRRYFGGGGEWAT